MENFFLQDKYLMNFFVQRPDGLQYKEVKASRVSQDHFVVVDLSEIEGNKKSYRQLFNCQTDGE